MESGLRTATVVAETDVTCLSLTRRYVVQNNCVKGSEDGKVISCVAAPATGCTTGACPSILSRGRQKFLPLKIHHPRDFNYFSFAARSAVGTPSQRMGRLCTPPSYFSIFMHSPPLYGPACATQALRPVPEAHQGCNPRKRGGQGAPGALLRNKPVAVESDTRPFTFPLESR